MKLLTSKLILQTDTPLSSSPEKLRGFIASQHTGNPVYHQHGEAHLQYRYPLIHYLILNDEATITGYKEGVNETTQLFKQITTLTLGMKNYTVIRKSIQIDRTEIGLRTDKISYRFVTPWLALNEVNYVKFIKLGGSRRKQLLEKILIGNILSASKGLDYTVPGKIETEIIWARPTACRLKGTSIIGFKGAFNVNFTLPHLFGLGKSVSRGFGAVASI